MLIALAWAGLQAASSSYHFACKSGETFAVEYVTAQGGAEAQAILTMPGKAALRMRQVESGSGARYTDGYTTLWTKGQEAGIESAALKVKGCQGIAVLAPGPAGGEAGAALAGRWTLRDLGGKVVATERPAYLEFLGDAAGSGFGGCNRFSVPVTVSGPELTFGVLTSTRIGCSGRIMQVEGEFLRGLSSVRRYSVAGGELVLMRSDGEAVARLRRE